MSSDTGSARSASPGKIDRSGLVAALKACGALQFGTFTLASGKTSSYYVDIKKAITRPELLRTIAKAMAPFARGASRIAGVELGAVPIAAAVSLASDTPYIIVRKAAKEHGTKHEFEGEFNRGYRGLRVRRRPRRGRRGPPRRGRRAPSCAASGERTGRPVRAVPHRSRSHPRPSAGARGRGNTFGYLPSTR